MVPTMKRKVKVQARYVCFTVRLFALADGRVERRGQQVGETSQTAHRKPFALDARRGRPRIRRRRKRLVTRSMWYSFDSSRRGGHDGAVNRFALYDLGFCVAGVRFSHSSLGALRVLTRFSTSRRLLDGLNRDGLIVDPSLWCSFVSPQRVEREYTGFTARLFRFTFALFSLLVEPTAKPVPFDAPCRREHNGADDEA